MSEERFQLDGPAAQYFERCLDSAHWLDDTFGGNEVAVGQYLAATIRETTAPGAVGKPGFRDTMITMAFNIDILRQAPRTAH